MIVVGSRIVIVALRIVVASCSRRRQFGEKRRRCDGAGSS
jgi:hypothetical protein